MNYGLYRDMFDPLAQHQSLQQAALFKDQKPVDVAPSKKMIGALTWDLSGTKLVTGGLDGYIKVNTRVYE